MIATHGAVEGADSDRAKIGEYKSSLKPAPALNPPPNHEPDPGTDRNTGTVGGTRPEECPQSDPNPTSIPETEGSSPARKRRAREGAEGSPAHVAVPEQGAASLSAGTSPSDV